MRTPAPAERRRNGGLLVYLILLLSLHLWLVVKQGVLGARDGHALLLACDEDASGKVAQGKGSVQVRHADAGILLPVEGLAGKQMVGQGKRFGAKGVNKRAQVLDGQGRLLILRALA